MSQEDMMDLDKKYTVQVTIDGLIITDEKGEILNRYHADHLLKRWNRFRHASIYLCWGINRKKGGYAHKIGFSNDTDRRMQQLGLNIVHQIDGHTYEIHTAEQHLQGYFIEQGKWLGGEYFDLTDADVEFIKTLQTTREIRALNTHFLWEFIPNWFREDTAYYKKNYVKGLTYTEWAEQIRLKRKALLDEGSSTNEEPS